MSAKTRGHWVLVVAAVLASWLVACGDNGNRSPRYHCPMHPTYVAERTGDCPICGMRLVPIEAEAAPATVPSYSCPMHPEVVSPKPDRCPLCGMKLTPAKEGPAVAAPVESSPESNRHGRDTAGEGPPGPTTLAGYAPVSLKPEGIVRSGIQTTLATWGTLEEPVRAVGTVVPDERLVSHVHTKVAGWVETLYVNFTGQYVRRGEPLLELYSPELLASQEEYLRARQLWERLAASDSEQARRAAQDLVQAARQRLLLFDVPEEFIDHLTATGTASRTVTLRAPRTGYVLSKTTFAGHRVEPGMELYTVVDLSRVWVEADFYESEVGALELGARARITLPYRPGSTWEGPITYMAPTVNPETRTVRVRVELANPRGELKPAMYASVEVVPKPARGVLIPDSAVMDTGTRTIVFVEEKPGFFAPREVTVAQRAGGQALLGHGLAPGERVVVKGTFLLDSESRLRAALAAPPGENDGQAHH